MSWSMQEHGPEKYSRKITTTSSLGRVIISEAFGKVMGKLHKNCGNYGRVAEEIEIREVFFDTHPSGDLKNFLHPPNILSSFLNIGVQFAPHSLFFTKNVQKHETKLVQKNIWNVDQIQRLQKLDEN